MLSFNAQSGDQIHQDLSDGRIPLHTSQLTWFLSSKFPQGKVGEVHLQVELQVWMLQRKKQKPKNGQSFLLVEEEAQESASVTIKDIL